MTIAEIIAEINSATKKFSLKKELISEALQKLYDRVKENFLPAADEQYGLGSTDFRWLDIFTKNIWGTGQIQSVSFSNYSVEVYNSEFIDYDFSASNIRTITLTKDAKITWNNLRYGRSILRVLQDSTGGHKITFPKDTYYSGSFSQTAYAHSILDIIYDGTGVYVIATSGFARL